MFNLYQEILMDHYRAPHNRGGVESYDFCGTQRNSSCGDEVVIMGVVKENKVVSIGWVGKGCVISQATASILSVHVKNMVLDDIIALDHQDLTAMIGMSLGPVRLLCGVLSLTALQCALREFKTR